MGWMEPSTLTSLSHPAASDLAAAASHCNSLPLRFCVSSAARPPESTEKGPFGIAEVEPDPRGADGAVDDGVLCVVFSRIWSFAPPLLRRQDAAPGRIEAGTQASEAASTWSQKLLCAYPMNIYESESLDRSSMYAFASMSKELASSAAAGCRSKHLVYPREVATLMYPGTLMQGYLAAKLRPRQTQDQPYSSSPQ